MNLKLIVNMLTIPKKVIASKYMKKYSVLGANIIYLGVLFVLAVINLRLNLYEKDKPINFGVLIYQVVLLQAFAYYLLYLRIIVLYFLNRVFSKKHIKFLAINRYLFPILGTLKIVQISIRLCFGATGIFRDIISTIIVFCECYYTYMLLCKYKIALKRIAIIVGVYGLLALTVL